MPRPTHYAFFDWLRLRYILLAIALICTGLVVAGKLGWLPPPPVQQPVLKRPGY